MGKAKCEANINPKCAMKIIIAVLIAGLVVLVLAMIPLKAVSDSSRDIYGNKIESLDRYNIFGEEIFVSAHSIHIDYSIYKPHESVVFWIGAIISLFTLLYLLFFYLNKSSAKQCSLILDDKGINGKRKTLFSCKELRLPMNKIDSITIQRGILDRICGGKTIAIRSASGLINFPWVQNAQEFVDMTLEEIQKYDEAVELKNTAESSDEFEKVKKLKELQQQGLLTEEEFEAKKKQLLGL